MGHSVVILVVVVVVVVVVFAVVVLVVVVGRISCTCAGLYQEANHSY